VYPEIDVDIINDITTEVLCNNWSIVYPEIDVDIINDITTEVLCIQK